MLYNMSATDYVYQDTVIIVVLMFNNWFGLILYVGTAYLDLMYIAVGPSGPPLSATLREICGAPPPSARRDA